MTGIWSLKKAGSDIQDKKGRMILHTMNGLCPWMTKESGIEAEGAEKGGMKMEMRKKLPVGIENFESIRKMGFYYVDKT